MERNATRRRVITGMGPLLVSVALAGCSGSGDGADGGGDYGPRTVEMTDDLVFNPAELPAQPGQTVIWKNVGSVEHTVTAYEDRIPEDAAYFASGGFDSEQAALDAYPADGGIAGGESYEHVFETTGTFEYFCIPHEGAGMTGTIEVAEEGPQL